jgi:hypothetical protein
VRDQRESSGREHSERGQRESALIERIDRGQSERAEKVRECSARAPARVVFGRPG